MRKLSATEIHLALAGCAAVFSLYEVTLLVDYFRSLPDTMRLYTHPSGGLSALFSISPVIEILSLAMPAFLWMTVYIFERNTSTLDKIDRRTTKPMLTAMSTIAALVSLNVVVSVGSRLWGIYSLINGPVVNHESAMYAEVIGPAAIAKTTISILSSMAIMAFVWLVRADYSRRFPRPGLASTTFDARVGFSIQ